MCKYLCNYDREPANPREARIWRKMYYNNHGEWPASKNINVNKKQIKPTPAPAEKSSPAEEWQQDSLFEMPKPDYYLNH